MTQPDNEMANGVPRETALPTKKELEKASKFLSFVLRHKPEAIGLELDANGWVSLERLIEQAAPEISLNRGLVLDVIRTSDKQRFALSEDGKSIRANQGHSVQVDLQLKAMAPPSVLFHGTATRFLESIHAQGLRPGQRHHVHLSADLETAVTVGRRHGKPVVLSVDADRMHAEGFGFFLSENGVWLTEKVPPRFLSEA